MTFTDRQYQMLFGRYFGVPLDAFDTPNGFPIDLWDFGKSCIDVWMRRGL